MPEIEDIYPILEYVKEKYAEYDEIHVAYTSFIKMGVFKSRIFKLLPLYQDDITTSISDNAVYTIEPDSLFVLNELSNIYIDLELYEAILSTQVSEHSARIIAMKKASDNVKTLVKELTLKMNKERQAKITQQMAEISSNV